MEFRSDVEDLDDHGLVALPDCPMVTARKRAPHWGASSRRLSRRAISGVGAPRHARLFDGVEPHRALPLFYRRLMVGVLLVPFSLQ